MTNPTHFLDLDGGRIAYEVTGSGPLIVLSPGMADTRAAYRFLMPLLVASGYRVAAADLRGHGESTVDWPSYTHADTAADLLALVEELGGPAVLVGQSFSGGAVTLAATTRPDLVSAIVEIDPFTRPPKYSLSAFVSNGPYRRGGLLLGRFAITGGVSSWAKYLDLAYPGRKPADWDEWLAALTANLTEPGRTKAAQKMMNSSATLKQAGAALPEVSCPALVVMGDQDSDFPDPEAEARGLVAVLPTGRGTYVMVPGAGHYPHAEYPAETAQAILDFLAKDVDA